MTPATDPANPITRQRRERFLSRQSVIEMMARERARALLDPGTFRELLGPFDRLESPWLPLQGIVPESDDGVIVARGQIACRAALIMAIEGAFQGGGMGEVSASKIAAALALARRDCENRKPIVPVLLLETGGVRLQEANLGEAVVAEIHAEIIALRRLTPVIGVVTGMIGCFGGMSITAGLCSYLVAFPQHAEIRRTIAEASEVVGLDMDTLDNAQAQQSTATVQIGLLVAGVATARALMAEHVLPGAVAGMSVGAFGATVACGTLSFADALKVVRLRGELMQAAFPSGYGMTAVVGLDDVHVEGLVARIRTAERPIYISNINSPQQIVVVGSEAALSALTILGKQHGARRVDRLTVGVPSHCPLFQPVADRLTRSMAKLSLRPPAMAYISNRGGRALWDADAIREDLATNVAHAVRWFDTLEVLLELGTTLFLEMAPGHVSTQIVEQWLSGVRAVSITDRGLRFAATVAARAKY